MMPKTLTFEGPSYPVLHNHNISQGKPTAYVGAPSWGMHHIAKALDGAAQGYLLL